VAPLLKETSREARVEVEIPNPEGVLKPGMFVRAAIEFDRHANATVVPFEALAQRDGRQGVFLADLTEKKAHFVPVTVGIKNGGEVEVTAPPLSGMVVTLGQHLLTDGSPITVAEAAHTQELGAEAQPAAESSPTRGSPQ
jgi:multidrug efflux pump subunit AcrA (membrane-fusion protein)